MNKLDEQAFDLLQQALVYCPSVVSYAHGSMGIGLVLLYLLDNGFVDGDYMELTGEQHRQILESLLSDKVEFQNMQDCSGIGLFLHTARPYISDKDFLSISEQLKKYFIGKCDAFVSMEITSFSTKPLFLAIHTGLFLATIAALYFPYALWKYFDGTSVSGWASLIMVIVFLGGIQIFLIGIIGIYISKIFKQTKKRPIYLIQSSKGV